MIGCCVKSIVFAVEPLRNTACSYSQTGKSQFFEAGVSFTDDLIHVLKDRGLINLNHSPSVGTLHRTSLRKELHFIKYHVPELFLVVLT